LLPALVALQPGQAWLLLPALRVRIELATRLASRRLTTTRMFADPKREFPLDLYRNIGIMAHIDAGKASFFDAK
jgi:hypothetical protein